MFSCSESSYFWNHTLIKNLIHKSILTMRENRLDLCRIIGVKYKFVIL